MSKIITVVGATGIQGGSVISALLDHGEYKLRGVTRDPNSASAKALSSKGVELVKADLNNVESLKIAFQDSYAIFAVTNYFADVFTQPEDRLVKDEVRQGSNLAAAAAATSSLEHYIWSSLPNSNKVSNGKISIPYYQSKNTVSDNIKANHDLHSKTTFLWVTWYASNLQYPFFKPFPIPSLGEETFIQISARPGSVPVKVAGDVTVNVGLFVKAILDQPDKAREKTVVASTETMTAGEILSTWGKVYGKKVQLLTVDEATYFALWPIFGELMNTSYRYFELVGSDSFSGEEEILDKDDLGVTGLVSLAEAIAKSIL